MTTPADESEPISSDEGERETVEPRAAGNSWTLGEHADLGLETVGDWSPPAYTREATADDLIRGIDSLLPERRHSPTVGRAGYRPESTIGADERVRVFETDKFPWRAICHLRIYSRFGDEYIATGWMIGPRTIITAGHCVYLPEMGGWAERIAVSPARNGRDRPFSTLSATKFHSVRGWTVSGKREHDYGAIVLPEDQALPEVGALGYSIYEVPKLVGSYVNLAGYPADKDQGTTMWWSARRSIEANETVFFYDADTAAGQSGAPVWRLDPGSGRRVVVGIHTNGARTGNSAVRINRRVFQNLRRWTKP
jgi:glutamyl endopeptidase